MAELCRHVGCRCEGGDDGFCSDYCREHGSKESHEAHKCGCGDPLCD